MRLVYLCDKCGEYITELNLTNYDESKLGFDILNPEERKELINLNWDQDVGTVKTLCDSCADNYALSQEKRVENLLH